MSTDADLEACRIEVKRLQKAVNKHDPRFEVFRDVKFIIPSERAAFSALATYLQNAFRAKKTRSNFQIFETYRSPVRQAYLFEMPKPITKARAWESAHNFGLAADFVPRDADGLWSWRDDEDWDFLTRAARQFNLNTPIEWDRPHVQSLRWTGVREALT